MPLSQAEYDARFGSAWHAGAGVKDALTYATFAGDPNGNVTPDHIGQALLDTTNDTWYRAYGTANTNWAVQGDSGADATVEEIDRVADVSARVVGAGSVLAVTIAAHEGRTILLDQTDGSVCTLPAATGSGARFRFFASAAIASAAHVVQVAASTDDEFLGVVTQTDTDTADALASYPALPADDFDTITLDGVDGGVGGDVIEVEDVAAGVWALNANVNGSGTVGTPLSSAITS